MSFGWAVIALKTHQYDQRGHSNPPELQPKTVISVLEKKPWLIPVDKGILYRTGQTVLVSLMNSEVTVFKVPQVIGKNKISQRNQAWVKVL